MSAPLADAAERLRIRTDTGATLFVNAGAGSGKTRALVGRARTLVLADGIRLSGIAAVTFTEKAGAELRDRLRAEFEQVWRAGDDEELKARAEQALDDLDAAAIGTLHAFAQRLLTEHPIEAGLPPLIEVLDEVASSVAFEERWAELQADLLDDDEVAEPLLLGLALGLTLKHVRSLAVLLGNDWDLITERVLSAPVRPVTVPDLTALPATALEAAALESHCTSADDKLLPVLHTLHERATLLAAANNLEEQIAVLATIGELKFSHGQAKNWGIPIQQVKDRCNAVTAAAGGVVGDLLDQCLRQITRWAAERVLAAADQRRADGRLEFHDLLVLARDLLRTDATVRAALHAKYQRLLLDEFQDTDPIQIELAVRIAGGAEAAAQRWQDVTLPAARLFVVGDAKQSIYRFRRASIRTYLDAQDHIGQPAKLTSNFRTVAPILDWVNDVFGTLIQFQSGAQPEYSPLDPARADTGNGPAVTVLGAVGHSDKPRASELREREAADVAAMIRQIIDDGWTVYDERAKQWRTAALADIAVLVPARTSLPFLEGALTTAQLSYRAEASSLVYQAAEVRSLLACARAIADSTDALSLVTALRSPLFGCGDDDLWRWKHAGGRFTIHSELDEHDPLRDGPVGSALKYLRRLSFDSRWLTPSEILGAIIADRRMLETAATGHRATEVWRQLRFVVDQARAWAEVSHGGLRGYLTWAARQGQEASRVAEAVLPETDSDSVRIMTIHAAKGLEFPIVIMSGMTAQPRTAKGVQLLWPPEGGYAAKLTRKIQTGDFDAVQPIDEQMDDLERFRLLYVAATRARDHLVVSLHRSEASNARTAANVLAAAGAATAAGATAFAGHTFQPAPAAQRVVSPPPAWDDWLAGVTRAREASRVVPAISASGLEGTEPEVALPAAEDEADAAGRAGKAKGVRDLELPPWSKGRYGSAIGRAVHGVLQVIDLTTGDGIDAAARGQAMAEGVVEHEGLIRELVHSALDSDIVKRAAAREHWREMYVGTLRQDGTILEGYIDLVYREDDGSLVIVDYKTDAVPRSALPSRVTYYKPQMDAYVEALQAAVAASTSATLLFLNPSAAVAEPVPQG